MHRKTLSKMIAGCAALTGTLLLTGCARDGSSMPVSMWNESRLKPLEESPVGSGQTPSFALVRGTVARGSLAPDDPVLTGRTGKKLVGKIPVPIDERVIARGQERFIAYCSPCHGRLGDGNGMIVRRGFPHPPDYAIKRLREAPAGHFYDVITNGYGVMYSYASRVPVNDRWAIAAYIRVLQDANPKTPVEEYRSERLRARRTGIGVRPTNEEPAAEKAPR